MSDGSQEGTKIKTKSDLINFKIRQEGEPTLSDKEFKLICEAKAKDLDLKASKDQTERMVEFCKKKCIDGKLILSDMQLGL